jgi:hypothetical protein
MPKPKPKETRRVRIFDKSGKKVGYADITPQGQRVREKFSKEQIKQAFTGGQVSGVEHANPVEFRGQAVVKKIESPPFAEHHRGEFNSLVKQRKVSDKVIDPLANIVLRDSQYTVVKKGPYRFKASTLALKRASPEEKKALFRRVRAEYRKLLKAGLMPMDVRPPQIIVGRTRKGELDFRLVDTSIRPSSKGQIIYLLEEIGRKDLAAKLQRYLEKKNLGEFHDTKRALQYGLSVENTIALDWYAHLPEKVKQQVAEEYFALQMEVIREGWGIPKKRSKKRNKE